MTPLRRSLAYTNAIENMMGTVRRVSRNMKRWRNAAMALQLDGRRHAGSDQGLPSVEAHKHLPTLRAALAAHQSRYLTRRVERDADAA
jgi:putative transposase